MEFKQIVAPTMKELFEEQIEEKILKGELKPGDSLPTERELASQMNVSKSVAHEGIQDLARMGFLSVQSRQGIKVADYLEDGDVNTLVAIMKFHGGNLDRDTAVSLLNFRRYLETPLMRQLAAHHTEEDIKALRQKEKEAREAEALGENAFAKAFLAYHHTLCLRSGDKIIPLVFNAFAEPGLEFWKKMNRMFGAEASLNGLTQFTDCIEQGKGEEAAKLFDYGIDAFIEKY